MVFKYWCKNKLYHTLVKLNDLKIKKMVCQKECIDS